MGTAVAVTVAVAVGAEVEVGANVFVAVGDGVAVGIEVLVGTAVSANTTETWVAAGVASAALQATDHKRVMSSRLERKQLCQS